MPQARNPNDRSIFELAASLMARARQLGPQEAELHGPMPLIREFQEFRQSEMSSPQARTEVPQPTALPAATIRVSGDAQSAKLVEKPDVVYPPQAREARIQGVVRFNVVIDREGRVENATLVGGHPLLVTAAQDAVRRYRYQPTLLNGAPVSVVSQVEVRFLFSN